MQREPDIEAAAQVGRAGLDVTTFLRTTDLLELATMQAVADRVIELQAEDREDLAVRIRKHIAEMLDG